ncbi:hypothetical protein HK101_000536, partial [Irineochytrium annulatum]
RDDRTEANVVADNSAGDRANVGTPDLKFMGGDSFGNGDGVPSDSDEESDGWEKFCDESATGMLTLLKEYEGFTHQHGASPAPNATIDSARSDLSLPRVKSYQSSFTSSSSIHSEDDLHEPAVMSPYPTSHRGSRFQSLRRMTNMRQRPSLAIGQPLPSILHSPVMPEPAAIPILPRTTSTRAMKDGGEGDASSSGAYSEGLGREAILESAGSDGCKLTAADCLMWSRAFNNPLTTIALESGLFSFEALDFL